MPSAWVARYADRWPPHRLHLASRWCAWDPFRGAVAQGTTAVVQVLGYFLLQVPFSSSHLATASALGAGVNQRFNALKSRIVLQILLVWLVTIPACFVLGVLAMVALQSIS